MEYRMININSLQSIDKYHLLLGWICLEVTTKSHIEPQIMLLRKCKGRQILHKRHMIRMLRIEKAIRTTMFVVEVVCET